MKRLPPALLLVLSSAALAAPTLLDEKAGVPQAPFDDARYALGFDVYIAGRNLPAAWQVARKAVSLLPDDAVWLKRYAQVSEWVGEPAEALSTWLRLARQTGSDESWEAVGRLAPMLLNDEALLAYQQRLSQQRPGDPAVLNRLIDIYERLGRPDDGLRYLKGLENGRARGIVLEAEAQLAERSGNDSAALAALDKLLASGVPREAWLLRRATLLYRRGELQRAQAGLAAAEPKMPPAAAGYWQTYAELSRLLNLTDTAERAYRILAAEGKLGEGDLWNYAALMQDKDPLAAAGLQERLFRTFHRDNGAINALSLWQSVQAWDAADRFLADLAPEERTRLETQPVFLEQRARMAWVRGRLDAARRDYALGLQRAPESLRLLLGLAGVLLEQNDNDALRSLLESRETLARRTEALWPAWSAGWQRLRQPSRALPFQTAWLQRHPEDPLAALALADTLDARGRQTQARELRARVLGRAAAHLDRERPERRRQLEDALLALSLQQAGSETGLTRLRARLAERPDAFSRDLALGWLLNHDSDDAARRFSALNSSAVSPWVSLGFALREEDRPAMNTLLNTVVEELPIYDRLEAAERLGRESLALDLAFNTLENEAPDDDELHNRYTRLAGEHGRRLDLGRANSRQGGLDIAATTLAWSAPLADRWRLDLDLNQAGFGRNDTATLGREPDDAQRLDIGLSRRGARSLWRAGLSRLDGLAASTGFRLAQEYTLDSRLRFNWRVDSHQPTTDSLALRVAGEDTRFGGGLSWTPDGRHQLDLQLDRHDYRVQGGGRLGDGLTLLARFSHRLFADQPDQVLKLQLARGSFSRDTAMLSAGAASLVPAGTAVDSRFFVPQDYNLLSVAWAFGQLPENLPARGWRGFGEAGLNGSDNGGGYRLELGVQGPVLGRDRLRVRLDAGRSATGQGDDTRELALDYRIYY